MGHCHVNYHCLTPVHSPLRLREAAEHKVKFETTKVQLPPAKGHFVSGEWIKIDPEKTEAVREWPTPTSVSELKGFLALVKFYRGFIMTLCDGKTPKLLAKEISEVHAGIQTRESLAFCDLKHSISNPPL